MIDNMPLPYIKVTPTRQSPNTDNVIRYFSGLYNLDDDNTDVNIVTKVAQTLFGKTVRVPRFVFLMVTEGKNAPVEFLYGTGHKWTGHARTRPRNHLSPVVRHRTCLRRQGGTNSSSPVTYTANEYGPCGQR